MRAAMPGTADRDAVVREALRAERQRNGRRGALFRLLSVSILVALDLICEVLLELPLWQGHLGLFACYWIVALLSYLGVRRYPALGEFAGVTIALLDVPMVFLLIRGFLVKLPERPDGPATFALATYIVFVILAALSIDVRQIVLAATVAAACAAYLQVLVTAPFEIVVMCVLLMVLAAFACVYASERSVALVSDVAAEHQRRERLGRYFSPEVAALLADRNDDDPGSETREVTVLFSDLRDFTALSERLSGAEVVALLNQCHEQMVEMVFAHGGTLDKYLGDGLMAYFGAPVAQPDHAERAVRCALAMQERLAELNQGRAASGGDALRMGIGVHTGTVVLGNIGARRRREYTAIGDTVNVAARTEELTKSVGAPILVSEETRRRVGDAIAFTAAEPVRIRGRTQPLQSFMPARSAPGG
jgi:adenylate cyclase